MKDCQNTASIYLKRRVGRAGKTWWM